MERIECYVGCPKCNTVVGKVIAKTRPDNETMWIHVPVPDPLPKYCECKQVIQRI